jgi:hypothetical protein
MNYQYKLDRLDLNLSARENENICLVIELFSGEVLTCWGVVKTMDIAVLFYIISL